MFFNQLRCSVVKNQKQLAPLKYGRKVMKPTFRYMKLKLIPVILAVVPFAVQAQQSERFLRDSLPSAWQTVNEMTQTFPTDDMWWRTFNDTILTRLIEKGVVNNFNVASAMKRIELAGKAVKEAESGYFPTLSLGAGWNKSQTSGAMGAVTGPASRMSSFTLGATMNWELDVFGRVNAGVKQGKASYRASKADYDGVMVSLCADIADAYLQLRTCQKQLAVALAHIESQKRVVEITEARYQAELVDMLDVTQARTVLYTTQASLPGLQAQIKALANSLAILTGEYPGKLSALLLETDAFPEHSSTVAAGVPADLLRRRPDIMQAEANLAQLAAAVGIAKKDFLPSLTFTGSIGTQAHKAGNLFGEHSMYWSVAPQLSWTLFDGLARNYRTAEARLQFEAAIDEYNLTVMNAVEETDNALTAYEYNLQSIELDKKVVEESHKALAMAVDLYKTGLTPFSNVVDGQMTYLESQNTLVAAEGKALRSLVTIYKALGGGWKVFPETDEK